MAAIPLLCVLLADVVVVWSAGMSVLRGRPVMRSKEEMAPLVVPRRAPWWWSVSMEEKSPVCRVWMYVNRWRTSVGGRMK